MYPLDVFTLFPSFPRENKVFVAMSFGGKHDDWYKNVIKEAIDGVSIDSDEKLESFRVDNSQTAHSINAEIIKNISYCRLFFADITTLGHIQRDGKKYACRNNNVMYELGLATATRLSKEIIMFRSDDDPLPLDMYDLHVNTYDSDPEKAKEQIKTVLESAIKEIRLQKLWSIQHAVDSLTDDSWKCLLETFNTNGMVTHPRRVQMGEVLVAVERTNSINQLLELGILSANYPNLTIGLFEVNGQPRCNNELYQNRLSYELTSFGKVVRDVILKKSEFLRI
jgi:hypothetical protein